MTINSEPQFSPQFFIKISGKNADPEIMDGLIELVVEDNLHLPDMFTINIHDRNMRWTNSDTFDVKKPVEIAVRILQPVTRRLGPKTILIKGEITGVEPGLSDDGLPSLTVRGFDASHRLHQGRQTRSFLASTDSEIAQRIAEEVGLEADVEPTTTIHEHIIQNNQTNMEFLLERARFLGYDLYVEDKTLYFRSTGTENTASETNIPELKWGENLLSFNPNLSAMHQVDEVVVRSWDPKSKREIVGRANETKIQPEVSGLAKANDHFRGSNQILVSRPVHTQTEADALAQSMFDEMGGEMLQADGVCMGHPLVRAGRRVEILGFGEQFDGKYRVTAAIHSYHREHGYETRFTIGGQKPQTIAALLNQGQKGQEQGRGVAIGLVTNINDTEGLGRIKVKYPSLDDIDESPWMRIASPMAGEKRGFYCLPEVNDEVLVAFEQGDVRRPYMLGMLWNGRDHPPEANADVVKNGKVNRRIIRSRSGHEIILDDSNGAEKLIISDQSGNKITMEDNRLSIEIQGDLNIEATGRITIKGKSIDLN